MDIQAKNAVTAMSGCGSKHSGRVPGHSAYQDKPNVVQTGWGQCKTLGVRNSGTIYSKGLNLSPVQHKVVMARPAYQCSKAVAA